MSSNRHNIGRGGRRGALRAPNSARALHTRRADRTPNLYLNTSLEEVDYSVPRYQRPVMSDAEIAELERREEEARELAELEAAQKAKADEINRRADREADELDAHRRLEPQLYNSAITKIIEWQRTDPVKSVKFIEHSRQALLACGARVRQWDVLSWDTAVPDDVRSAIQTMQMYYHKEANHVYRLRVLENYFGGGSRGHGLDPEVYRSSRIDRLGSHRDPHGTFGLDKNYDDLKVFTERHLRAGEESSRILSIRANLRIRRTLLEAQTCDPEGRPRHRHNSSIKFIHTMDYSIFLWTVRALRCLQVDIRPIIDRTNNAALVQPYIDTVIELRSALSAIDTINLRATCKVASDEFEDALVAFDFARAHLQANPTSDSLQAKYAEEVRKLDDMTLRFTNFENRHGAGILGNRWRKAARDVIGVRYAAPLVPTTRAPAA